MKSKKTGSLIIGGVCLQIAALMLTGCSWRNKKASDLVCGTSIFSWEDDYIRPEREADVEKVMERLGCRAVYQQISADTEESLVLDYLKRRKDKEQLVYYLAGAPEWGVEEDAASMLEVVETAAAWNRKIGADGGFTGIVLDVEPYLLEEWDDNKDGCMEQYVANCILTYGKAKEENLAVIVCIPNFYDRTGLDGQLENLIRDGCDGIAVMNYNKRDEAGQISAELELAREYGKGILHITEMQQPGYHNLTENNTYYEDGFEAVLGSWDKLKEQYSYKRLGFSWHYMRPCLQIMEEEAQEEGDS